MSKEGIIKKRANYQRERHQPSIPRKHAKDAGGGRGSLSLNGGKIASIIRGDGRECRPKLLRQVIELRRGTRKVRVFKT